MPKQALLTAAHFSCALKFNSPCTLLLSLCFPPTPPPPQKKSRSLLIIIGQDPFYACPTETIMSSNSPDQPVGLQLSALRIYEGLKTNIFFSSFFHIICVLLALGSWGAEGAAALLQMPEAKHDWGRGEEKKPRMKANFNMLHKFQKLWGGLYKMHTKFCTGLKPTNKVWIN